MSIYKASRALTVMFLLCTAHVVAIYGQSTNPRAVQDQLMISTSYCDLALSPKLKLANLSFNVLYRFELDKNGRAVNIRKLRDDYVGIDSVKLCMSDWKIVAPPENTWYFATFFWSHRKGWFRQSISNPKFSQILEMEGVGITELVVTKDRENPK